MSLGAISRIKKRRHRQRKAKHPMVSRAYRFRLDVSPGESKKLFDTLQSCWLLRNALAEDRIKNRRDCKEAKRQKETKPHYLNRSDQYNAVKLYAKGNVAWGNLHSQVRQNVAVYAGILLVVVGFNLMPAICLLKSRAVCSSGLNWRK